MQVLSDRPTVTKTTNTRTTTVTTTAQKVSSLMGPPTVRPTLSRSFRQSCINKRHMQHPSMVTKAINQIRSDFASRQMHKAGQAKIPEPSLQ